MKLNDKLCKASKPFSTPRKTPNKLSDGEGLYLYVMPNGSKYWRFDYRIHGKQKTLALGVYPEVSLKEAREKRTEARQIVLEGKDPVLEGKRTNVLAAENSKNTFEIIAREWHDVNKSKWSEWEE